MQNKTLKENPKDMYETSKIIHSSMCNCFESNSFFKPGANALKTSYNMAESQIWMTMFQHWHTTDIFFFTWTTLSTFSIDEKWTYNFRSEYYLC